jgi:hypothetical protein
MNFMLDIKLLILISVANGVPIIAQNVFGRHLSFPVDCGTKFFDAQPVLGASKSIRGIALSLLATAIAAVFVGIFWLEGALIASAAMVGDLCSSFLKRRMRMPPSSMVVGLDQIPESLFPLLTCTPFLPLSAFDIAIVVACFFAGELLASRVLYRIHLRNRPY